MAQVFPMEYGPTQNAERLAAARVLVAEFGDGYGQRAGDGIHNVRDSYALSWDGLTRTEANTADTFLRNHGGYTAFLWTSPGGTQRLWVCKEWRVRHTTATLDSLSATFVEVFDQ